MSLQIHTFIDEAGLYEKQSHGDLYLFILLGKNYLQYCFTSHDRKKILLLKNIYKASGTIGNEEMELAANETLYSYVKSTHIAIDTIKNTQVPDVLFSNADKLKYFVHVHEVEPDDEIKTQSINGDIQELYMIKKTSAQYLQKEFQQVKIYSQSACLLNAYNKLATDEKQVLYISVSPQNFYLTLYKDKQLQYHFGFESTAASDIMYHTTHLLNAKNISAQEAGIYLTGFSSNQNEIAELLQRYYKVNTIDKTKIPEAVFNEDFPLHILYNLYSLVQCVS